MEAAPALSVVAISYSQPEAWVIVSKLRAYGIDAFLPDGMTIGCNVPWMTALGGIRIMVPFSDAPIAHELILETAPPTEDEAPKSMGTFKKMLLLIFALMGGVPPPRVKLDL